MRLVFHIEDRGYEFIYHWFIYMIGGLKYIENKTITSGTDGAGPFTQNLHLLQTYNQKEDEKIFLHFRKKLGSFHQETFDLLKEKFEFITEVKPEDIVLNNYGVNRFEKKSLYETYDYLRKLFQEKIQITEEDIVKYANKRLFLSRSKAHTLNGNNGLKRRHILNESILTERLKTYNIQTIYLEDFGLVDKIKIFMLSDMIISPNSGGLIFSLFANSNTKFIEINVQNPHQISDQYGDIINYFQIPYFKFMASKADQYDNMFVDVEKFVGLLEKI